MGCVAYCGVQGDIKGLGLQVTALNFAGPQQVG